MIPRFTTARWSLLLAALLFPLAAVADSHDHSQHHRRPAHDRPVVTVRGALVFIGGYYYDPFFGPYPWWRLGDYQHRYYPTYGIRAEVRFSVKPKTAGVYVDGFYAGVIDDFDGVFQSLPLAPGGHEITLYLQGYRTLRRSIYLGPGSSFKFAETLEPLPPGMTSERPEVSPPIPPPPAGTFRRPVTPDRNPDEAAPPPPGPASPLGELDLHVQPAEATVSVDGERWLSSDPGHFMVDLPKGPHRVEVSLTGYQPFSTEIVVKEGGSTPLNISLVPERK